MIQEDTAQLRTYFAGCFVRSWTTGAIRSTDMVYAKTLHSLRDPWTLACRDEAGNVDFASLIGPSQYFVYSHTTTEGEQSLR